MRKILAFAFLLMTTPAYATNYYVTQAGAGAMDGTSLLNAWSVSQYNAATLDAAGNTVFFDGVLTSQVVPKSGVSLGLGMLTLNFSGSSCSTVAECVSVSNKAYINIIDGTYAQDGTAITFANSATSHDISISGWTLTGTLTGNAALVWGRYVYNLTIENNTINNGTIIFADTTRVHDITIRNNYCQTGQNVTAQTDIIQFGDAYNITIEGNKLINRAPGASTDGRHNDVIQNFRSGSGTSGNPYNWIIRYNWIEVAQTVGSGGNMSWMHLEEMTGQPALKVYSNIFVGGSTAWTGGNGIRISLGVNASDTYYFYGNTGWAHSNPPNMIAIAGPGTMYWENNAFGSDFAQNIAMTMTAGAANYNSFKSFSNCGTTYSGANGSCSLTTAAFTNTAVNNFALAAASVLLGTGDSTIGTEYSHGIAAGATWPNPTLASRVLWDVGAYNQLGGSTGTPLIIVADSFPVPGNGGTLGVTSSGSSSLTLSWAAATDDKPGLLYEVRKSLSEIKTLADAESLASVIKAYTAGLLQFRVSGLKAADLPYLAVIVKDSAGQKSLYGPIGVSYGWHVR